MTARFGAGRAPPARIAKLIAVLVWVANAVRRVEAEPCRSSSAAHDQPALDVVLPARSAARAASNRGLGDAAHRPQLYTVQDGIVGKRFNRAFRVAQTDCGLYTGTPLPVSNEAVCNNNAADGRSYR